MNPIVRDQAKKVLDVFTTLPSGERSWRLDAPFLTNAEVVQVVRLAAVELGGPVYSSGSFSGAALKNWKKRGYFSPFASPPDLRNHLYCCVDVLALVCIQHISDWGIPIEEASSIAQKIASEELALGPGFSQAQVDGQENALVTVVLRRHEPDDSSNAKVYLSRLPNFEKPVRVDVQALMEQGEHASMLSIDWRRLLSVSVAVTSFEWKKKAARVIDKEIARLKGRKPKC